MAIARLPSAPASLGSSSGLRIEGVSHTYGQRRVVHDVSLDVPPGEVHCLVGPSGCGKTTILRLVAGLEPLQGGRIVVGNEVVAGPDRSLPPEARRIGLMFQDYALFPHLRVKDNVGFGLRGLGRDERQRRVMALLTQVDMAGHAESYPHMLSGGEQQRVALARALAPQPRLMLLDEPFSSLDATLREQIRDDAIAILRAAGTPVLLVTHDADEAVRVADRIHVMLQGRILQTGSPAELYSQPASPFVATFFGPLNRFKGWVLNGRVSTPLGDVSSRRLDSGTAVDILIRPEAIRLQKRHTGGNGYQVQRIRDLGTNRILELQGPDGAMLTVRMAASATFVAGDMVNVEVDEAQVHIYPAGPAAQGAV